MRALLLRWATHTSRHSKGSLKFNTKFHQLRRCNQLIYLVRICMDLRQIYYFVPKCWSEKDQLGTPKLLPPWVLSDQWLMRRMVILNHLMRWGNLWDNQLGQTEVLIPPFLHLLGKIGKVCVSKVYLFFPVHFALTRVVFPALASHHPLCVEARYLPVPILNAIAYSEPVVSKMTELWVVQFWRILSWKSRITHAGTMPTTLAICLPPNVCMKFSCSQPNSQPFLPLLPGKCLPSLSR